MNDVKMRLLVCGGPECRDDRGEAVREALRNEIVRKGLDGRVELVESECLALCGVGPVMRVEPGDIVYQKLTPEVIPQLVEEHLVKGRPLKKLLYAAPAPPESIPKMDAIPFFRHQSFWVMRNKGAIDPEVIDEYIARDGYFGAAKAVLELTPQQIVEEVKISGLRGRGGAGFPAGLKWEFAQKTPGEVKYVLCNADEGDPGAFMDRSVLEADPHAVLEGMIIAARAINARQGYIYARTEYPLAVKRLGIAIRQAREYGLLGRNIMGTGFDFDIDVYQGAGAFVCGEETALMRSIEGKRGMPRPRPPFPALKGLWEKPTILNNVETLANIPQIIRNGGKWFAAVGTEGSKGTKVFALSGDVQNIGLVEVPMGTSLRTLVFDIGGGVPDKKKFKAVQLGGPSGGCVPEQHLDIPVDYEAIAKVGAIMGSGGAIVMDEDTCMVDMARFFMDFVQDESCGKCTPCREGTRRLLQTLEKICEGRGESSDIETLEELSGIIKEASLCGLGQTGPNPVLSTLRYFRDEYEAHIHEKRCPAKRCVALLKFEVDPAVCTKCGACFRACPVEAITWKKKEVARIDTQKCIKCMTCFDRCKFDAIG
jgi:NADH:ubiquinone oxidoreductase subunit F (NADH-binding)/(2Fe-2S) ferredoxin/Pyruvate/2-oxoacid:ferredoxin oxidoreductase delta subunit